MGLQDEAGQVDQDEGGALQESAEAGTEMAEGVLETGMADPQGAS